MRGCVIGGVVLALVLTLVVCNAVFLRGVEASLLTAVDALPAVPDPDTTPARVAALRERVEELEGALGLSVSSTVPDKITETLRTVEVWAAAGDAEEYAAAVAVLRGLVEDIGRLERVEVRNLF